MVAAPMIGKVPNDVGALDSTALALRTLIAPVDHSYFEDEICCVSHRFFRPELHFQTNALPVSSIATCRLSARLTD